MKTKTLSTYIDLREVVTIGPLTNDRSTGQTFGCFVTYKHRGEGAWLTMAEDKIDPYQIDEAKNSLTRATATQNYNLFVEQWKAAD